MKRKANIKVIFAIVIASFMMITSVFEVYILLRDLGIFESEQNQTMTIPYTTIVPPTNIIRSC